MCVRRCVTSISHIYIYIYTHTNEWIWFMIESEGSTEFSKMVFLSLLVHLFLFMLYYHTIETFWVVDGCKGRQGGDFLEKK